MFSGYLLNIYFSQNCRRTNDKTFNTYLGPVAFSSLSEVLSRIGILRPEYVVFLTTGEFGL
jgi:hypothetical protein